MTASREEILSALLGVIQGMTFSPAVNGQSSWLVSGRRLKLWNDVPNDQQPAAFLVEHEEEDVYRGLGLLRRRLSTRVFCYARTDNPDAVGGTLLNTMLQSFEAALTPDDVSRNDFTLGGLVYWCRIEGRVFKDPGDIDNQALLVVPIILEIP